MAKVGMRLFRAQKVSEPGTDAVVMHYFELLAHLEQEGNYYAGCIEGFDGIIEAVGGTEKEVVQSLFEGFSMLVDHHMAQEDLEHFLESHGVQLATMDEPRECKTAVGVEREFIYMPNVYPVAGGLMACPAG